MFQKVNGCKKRPETAITQFKTSLSRLMDLLKTKEPSYIRCIKPNDFKLPGNFKIFIDYCSLVKLIKNLIIEQKLLEEKLLIYVYISEHIER